jgi:hypothetical protein
MEMQGGMNNIKNNLRQDIHRGFYDFNRLRISEHINNSAIV